MEAELVAMLTAGGRVACSFVVRVAAWATCCLCHLTRTPLATAPLSNGCITRAQQQCYAQHCHAMPHACLHLRITEVGIVVALL
jgi:hypothetical protein